MELKAIEKKNKRKEKKEKKKKESFVPPVYLERVSFRQHFEAGLWKNFSLNSNEDEPEELLRQGTEKWKYPT